MPKYFTKILTEYNKILKKPKEKETLQIQNYNHKPIKRIKSCYRMNQINSRNKKIFYENSLLTKDSNNSNKNIFKNGTTSFKISSTLNNIHKNKTLLSIDKDKKAKRIISKNNKIILDSKIINVIYSKRLISNLSSKYCIKNSKKIIKNKIIIPVKKKTSSNKKYQIQKSKNTAKMPNPFEMNISPPNTNRNNNKKISKFTLLSPISINSKFSTSRIIHKTLLKKNLQVNNKKVQFKKNIKKLLKENKSNKMIKRKNIIGGKQLNINNGFLTLNVEKKYKQSPSPIHMKKSIENNNNSNSSKSFHFRNKTLYNKLPEFYSKIHSFIDNNNF